VIAILQYRGMYSTRFGFQVQSLFNANKLSNHQGTNGSFFALSNSMAPVQQQLRMKSITRLKRRLKVPVAFPSMETLLTGSGITFAPVKKQDKSAIVGFSSAPKGYRERTDQAQKYGVNNFYLNEARDSVYTLHLDEEANLSQSLDEYVDEKKEKFRNKFPDSAIYPVKFDPRVDGHLSLKGVNHTAAIFHQRSQPQTLSGISSQTLPYMSLFLKTPGGFWRLNWYTKLENLLRKNQSFIASVRNLKVLLRDEPKKLEEPKDQPTTTKEQAPST